MKTEAYILRIMEETGLTRKEIAEKVEEKQEELKGLISDEGALYIIGKELGIDLKLQNGEKNMEEEEKDWMDEAIAEPPVIGAFLPLIIGVTYLLRFKEIENKTIQNVPVEKESRYTDEDGNKKMQTKYRFNMELVGVQVKSEYKALRDALKLTDEEAYEKTKTKIIALKKADSLRKNYTVELPKSGRFELGSFAKINKLQNDETFSMLRLSNTKWIFAKVATEE